MSLAQLLSLIGLIGLIAVAGLVSYRSYDESRPEPAMPERSQTVNTEQLGDEVNTASSLDGFMVGCNGTRFWRANTTYAQGTTPYGIENGGNY